MTNKTPEEIALEIVHNAKVSVNGNLYQYTVDEIAKAIKEAQIEILKPIQDYVDKQAKDETLWFVAQNSSEAYLQQELRKLHSVIESTGLNLKIEETKDDKM